MRGNTVADTWARIPGLSSYWCLQIQWRVDEDVVAALTEPRYPVPDESLDTIILVQTIYLLQLFLHLHEFDPCIKEGDPDEELLRLFQDNLAREFNTCYGTPAHARLDRGPCPDGESLERVVRGLMLAQREAGQQQPERSRSSHSDSPDSTKSRLQHLLVQLVAELNKPVYMNKSRYEEAHGPRTDETWAARFATRIIQWRFHMRNPMVQPALREQIIRVVEDAHALDEEGLEVYRMLRTAAPGSIHLVTPLQPELQPALRQPTPAHHGPHSHQHQRSISSGGGGGGGGMKMQHILASPLPQTPDQTPSASSATPRTPLFSRQVPAAVTPRPPSSSQHHGDSVSNKRASAHDLPYPPAKRPRSAHEQDAVDADATHPEPKREPPAADEGNPGGEIPIRGGQAGDAAGPPRAARAEVTDVLQRILEGVNGLHQKMEGLQRDLGQRFDSLDDRLQRLEDWMTDPV
ncbi:hypothetical protein KVR01_002005 [Diaporthe batatas]|uniref:uncharacterized protein n=1 Tax=Diaporthe batatas TaxID=748121 RepID=UPI001D0551A0|nr:uncharacterized protein KVR01_002005 [Diaporthe batatas]KAG8166316.1 hypothetical protein KVR01_002005 [Diaporthe batatas]